jgi:hypothetical protein
VAGCLPVILSRSYCIFHLRFDLRLETSFFFENQKGFAETPINMNKQDQDPVNQSSGSSLENGRKEVQGMIQISNNTNLLDTLLISYQL